MLEATTASPYRTEPGAPGGNHQGQETDEDEQAKPATRQLARRDAGQSDREGEEKSFRPETAPGTGGGGDHDDDEDHGRDQLEPGVEPVQRPGPGTMPLDPVKPHRA